MVVIPEVVPISELRTGHRRVLGMLGAAPVLLTQHGRAAAVLVDPAMWNRLVRQVEVLEEAVEELEDRRAALEVEARIAAGEERILDWAEVEAELADASAPTD